MKEFLYCINMVSKKLQSKFMCIDTIKQIEDVLLYFEKNERKVLQIVWILQKLMDLK
jgi:hypothetical protein